MFVKKKYIKGIKCVKKLLFLRKMRKKTYLIDCAASINNKEVSSLRLSPRVVFGVLDGGVGGSLIL